MAEGIRGINYRRNWDAEAIDVTCVRKTTTMKKKTLQFLLVFLMCGFLISAQTSSITNRWYEAPESSKGDTIYFKTTPHVLGPNENPAYHWSDFTLNANNSFDIKYWRWCPAGNYSYSGFWLTLPNGNVRLDFGTGKCKCEMQIISVSSTELKAIIKETTN